MTISIIPSLQNCYSVSEQHQDNHYPYCTLQWRRGQLLVKSPGKFKQPYLPVLYNQKSLIECLKHSPVSLVSLDPKLGEDWLKFWATACEQADKPMFLQLSSNQKFHKKGNSVLWWLRRLADWLFALISLLIISPVMLGLFLLMRIYSPGTVFSREWHVGERGRLFRAINFHTQNITPVERWICKYRLQNLPQLLNVLRGDMRFLGSNCWTLEDAVKLSLAGQQQLNAVPEIMSSWQVEAQFNTAGS
ncbi:heterocyst development glycosyltransferase HepC [Calothrix sp. PCC 7507]|uniref:heterocyst development glycosyltransferase HepC n=1 Tax=Calothrix sp. PCC 7507 TaxID=99598 RepID=UPI00029F4866|nr:heterocyst development glycosyltransferase HepC [Calothrix sp. PCC 7507]AFY31945.1 sugar transferase [Calothrix sp. PCC 7507]